MSSATLVSVQEYLAASFRPDRDYVDGELQERNLGEQPHSLMQTSLAAFLFNRRTCLLYTSLVKSFVADLPARGRVFGDCAANADRGATGSSNRHRLRTRA